MIKRWLYSKINSAIDCLEKQRDKLLVFKDKADNQLKLTHLNRVGKDFDLPEEKLKEIETHIDSLYWGIQEPSVFNIALSGGFGTGKSTIISQLIKQKKLSNYQIVSLGEFGEDLEKEPKERIEYSILEQLIFAVKAKDVPDSKINRITQTRWIGWKSIGIILFIYSIIYLFFDQVNNQIPSIPSWLNFEEVKWFWFIVFVLGLFFLIKKIYRSILDYRVSKISLSDIEISDSKNSSNTFVPLLNQYYDEILYYFVKTKKRILFIEDLDRFEHSRFIYNKLREVNTLLNHSSEFKNDKITFVYAIKNNFIGDATQTNKFFELVIPVLPFMSHKTSIDIFIRELEKSKSGEKVGEELENLIYLTSPFIFDARTIYSIVNDFKITKKNFEIQGKDFSDTKLLAFSIYKTVLNDDYDLLLRRKGILFNLFQNKNLIQNEKIREYKNKIEVCEKIIKEIEEEFPKSLEKLRKLFLGELSKKLKGSEYLRDITFDKLLNETVFEDYYKKSIIIRSLHNANTNSIKGFQELEKNLGLKYYERKNRILNKGEKEREEIKEYQRQIDSIVSKSIQELFDYDITNYWQSILLTSDLDIEFETKESLIEILNTDESVSVKKRKAIDSMSSNPDYKYKIQSLLFNNAQKVLQLLILNGYINENYINLLSYSYDVYLDSDTDIYYHRIIRSEMPDKDYLLKVDQVKKLIRELRPMYFSKPAILNFSIAHELLKNPESNRTKFNLFIGQFEKKSIHLESVFVGIFHKEEFDERQRFLFAKELLKINCFWIQLQNIKADEFQNNILAFIFNRYYKIKNELTDAEFKALKIKLTDFINEDESVLNKADNIDSLDILNELNYKIKKTHSLESHIKNIVFDKKLFELNENNLKDCMSHNNHNGELNVGSINNLYSAYKDVWGLDVFLIDLKTIIEIIVNNDDQVIEKSDNALELVLNDEENLDLDQKKSYIHKVNFELPDISKVDNIELWETIIEFKRLKPKWNNVKQYFVKNNLDDNLIEFINDFSKELKFDEYDFVEQDARQDLLKKILTSEEINDKKIFDKSFIRIKNIGFLENQQDLIAYFLDQDFIEINRVNFDFLSEENKLKLIDKYFDHKFDDETSYIENLNITFEDIKDLYHRVINEKAKILLTEYLIQHDLQSIDLAYNEKFTELFVRNLFEINSEMLTYQVVEHILLSESIDLNSKIELAIFYLKQENIEEPKISDVLDCLGKEYKTLSHGERTHFENNELNKLLLKQLYNLNYTDEPRLISKGKKISIRKL